jgi:CIC family chloride channel protein
VTEEKTPNIFDAEKLSELFHFSHFTHFYRTYVPASILIGLICGLFMVAFQILIDITTSALSWLPIFISPLIGGIFSGALIYFGMNEIEGSGISKAIELTHEPAELQNRTALTKLMATSISIGSGCPVGREGPAVLIGAAIGNLVGRKLGFGEDAPHLRVFLMMGSAACTAGIYKAPLGGALFATEAPYKRDARLGYFVPTVIAALSSYIIFTLIMGINPLFTFEASFTFALEEIPLLVFLGFVAGIIGILFSAVLLVSREIFRVTLPDWADPIAGSILACFILFILGLFINPPLTIAGMGYEVIGIIATTTIPLGVLLALLFGKLFASSFVVGGRVSGGVLASSLFVGAMLGAVFGELFYPDSVVAFVVLGMGAVLAATTNTPVATLIMMLEMSLSFDLVIPLAICISVSYLVSGGASLYQGQKVARDDEDPQYYAPVNVPAEFSPPQEEKDANLKDFRTNQE